MKKRKIKKLFASIDNMSMPSKEKILPSEALIKSDSGHKKKMLPRFAVGVSTAIAIVISVVLMINIITSTSKKNDNYKSIILNNDIEHSNKSDPSVLQTESLDDESRFDNFTSKESEIPSPNFPIVFCGKYVQGDDSYMTVYPGEVGIRTMDGSQSNIDMDKLQNDVLYAVCFRADFSQSSKYKEEIKKLEDEHKGDVTPESSKIFAQKSMELYNGMNEAETANMYEYLEDSGVEFYDKTVYILDDETVHVLDDETEPKKIISEEVYRVAFLTKDKIKSLKGGENYGILIEIVFEELAKMDNDPVYIEYFSVDD